MSQTNVIPRPTPTDPFFYGFREVVVTLPDGTKDYQTVPLTLEDVLHPQLDDKIMNGTHHDDLCTYLKNVLAARLRHDENALVLHDCGVYWDIKEIRHHGPDIAIIFGVREQQIEWTGFMVADEGVRPTLIIEIVSRATRETDFGKKIEHYHIAGVPQYVIVDRDEEGVPSQLLTHRDTPDGYLLEAADERGRVLLECVNLWLDIRGADLVLIDAETGEELKSYDEINEAWSAAELRADSEERRAKEASRLAKKETRRAETEKLRAEEQERRAESEARRAEELARRAETEKLRAEEQERRAETEKLRADAADQKMREMEDELRRLRGNG